MEKDTPFTQPNNGHLIFAALRDVLADLYPEENDARVVVADAGLDAKQITFSPRAQTNWHNILAEAIRQAHLDPLLKIALADYAANPALIAAYGQYRLLIDQGGYLDATEHSSNTPLSPEGMRTLLARYRRQVAEETRYVKLEGIPLSKEDKFTVKIPLQHVYIRIQDLKKDQELRRAREESLSDEIVAAQQERHQPDPFDLISRPGEEQYRRGESIESRQQAAPIDPEEAISKYQHLMILGAPGSGKSTLLRYLAHKAAGNEASQAALLVPLGDFAQAYRLNRLNRRLSLIEWFCDRAALHDEELHRALRQAIASGAVRWLFDGLDETGDLREETSRQISQVAWNAPVVVTSRPLDYQPTHLERFTHYEVLPLATDSVKEFITNMLSILAEQQGYPPEWIKERSDWLQQQLDTHPRIHTLTQNPLLLTFLVILACPNLRRDLPDGRSDLYARYVEKLFTAWEKERRADVRGKQQHADHHLLTYLWGIEAIAWYLHLADYGRTYSTKEHKEQRTVRDRIHMQQRLTLALQQTDRARQPAEAEAMAAQIIGFWISTGLIEERENLLAFRHLTFQEYGVSKVLDKAWQEDLKRTWRFLQPRLHHSAWREPLRLLAEQMKNKDQIDRLLQHLLRRPSPYDRILWRDLYLAAILVGESRSASSQTIQQLVSRLSWGIRSDSLLFRFGLRRLWPMSEICRTAIAALGQVGDERAVEPLFKALMGSEDWDVCWRAADALRQLGDTALDPLIRALTDSDRDVRRNVAAALGQVGNERAVEPLLRALKDSDWDVRRSAAAAIRRLRDTALEPLIRALKDSDQDVCRGAVEALGELGNKRAVEPLIMALKDIEDVVVRRSVASALGKLGDERAVEPLLTTLKDRDEYVRRWAADALRQLGHPALDPLLRTPKAARTRATSVFGGDVSALWQPSDKRAVEPFLTALENSGEVEPLLTALKDIDEYVRRNAAAALGQLGDKRAVEPLITALKDTDGRVRRSAAAALGQLGDERAVEPLITALKDTEDWGVRWRAAFVLGQLGNKRAVEPLITALKDIDVVVRWRAVAALGQLDDEQAVEPLLRRLKDTDEHVCRRAAITLGQLGTRHIADWEHTRFQKIAAALRWRIIDKGSVDERIFDAFSAIVNRFPITASIDDLLLPASVDNTMFWYQFRGWFGILGSAALVVAIAAITGVLGNLLSEWLKIAALQETALRFVILIVVVASVILVIINQLRSNNS